MIMLILVVISQRPLQYCNELASISMFDPTLMYFKSHNTFVFLNFKNIFSLETITKLSYEPLGILKQSIRKKKKIMNVLVLDIYKVVNSTTSMH